MIIGHAKADLHGGVEASVRREHEDARGLVGIFVGELDLAMVLTALEHRAFGTSENVMPLKQIRLKRLCFNICRRLLQNTRIFLSETGKCHACHLRLSSFSDQALTRRTGHTLNLQQNKWRVEFVVGTR